MKVILLEDIKNLGKKNDIVDASDSYARNFLIKNKKAKEATGANLNDLKLKMANDDKNAAKALADAQELKGQIATQSISIKIKVGEGGRTFGSVTSKEISEAIKSQLNITVDKKKINMKEAIKDIGTYDVPIKLHPQVTGNVKVKVEAM